MSKSRGRHRSHDDEHEEHVNHEAWVIPYADMLTLLMALFLVLYALGGTDDENLELAAESFRDEISGPGFLGFGGNESGVGGPLAAGGISVLDGLGALPDPGDDGDDDDLDDDSLLATPPAVLVLDPPTGITESEGGPPVSFDPLDETAEHPGDPLDEVERAVREEAEGTGLTDAVGFRREARGLVVSIVTDRVLFDPGSATIQDRGFSILDVIAGALVDLSNDVMVEGHTDRQPISTDRFPTNWELSTARATSVLRYLVEEDNFPIRRISAAGYADTRPVDTGSTADALAKNRRVEIVVLATATGG